MLRGCWQNQRVITGYYVKPIPGPTTLGSCVPVGRGHKAQLSGNQWSPLPQSSNKNGRTTDDYISSIYYNNRSKSRLLPLQWLTASNRPFQQSLSHDDCRLRYCFFWNRKCLTWGGYRSSQSSNHQPSVRHSDEPQSGQNSCLWLFHLCWMTGGEAITGCHSIGLRVPLPTETSNTGVVAGLA